MNIPHTVRDIHGIILPTIDRHVDLSLVRAVWRRSRVVALLGPRQCGKTTLARQFVSPQSLNYFDLEDPQSLARLSEPNLALRPLKLVVIDEIQRPPICFRSCACWQAGRRSRRGFLFWAAHRRICSGNRRKLWRADLGTVPLKASVSPIWVRLPKGGTGCGGFPLAYTPRREVDSVAWRGQFLQTFLDATCLS